MKMNDSESAQTKEKPEKTCLSRLLFATVTVVTVAALVCLIIGFGESSWITVDRGNYTEHIGIWKICTGNPSECYSAPSSDWMRAVQSFAVIGFVLLFFCFIVSIVLQCPCEIHKRWAPILIAVFGVISLLLCIAIFSSKKDEIIKGSPPQRFSYSFGLCITAMILAIIVVICLIVEYIFTGTNQKGKG
ncbi:uncharacterized protein LOC134260148 [Saccostrea cucullata]|uniref:uncharacterized protein LOC134260148 n=1 Tax=Saccostrea cuccullata TaxID=36930 RepID=UPI002ED42247